MSFQLFNNMKNFILKVFLCLLLQALENLGWIKLALKFEDFPAPTAIFKDFQGVCKAGPCATLMFVLFTFSLSPPSPTTLPCSATPYKYKGPTRAWGSVKRGSQLRNHSILFCQLSGGSRSGFLLFVISVIWKQLIYYYCIRLQIKNMYMHTYARSPNKVFFRLFGPQFGLKIRGRGSPGTSPRSATVV